MSVLISGTMLKAIRKQKKLSQQNLAVTSGVGIATIKRIESSKTATKRQFVSVTRIAAALGVSLDDLSEDKFNRVVNIGDDIELNIERCSNTQEIRDGMEQIIKLVEMRNRILGVG